MIKEIESDGSLSTITKIDYSLDIELLMIHSVTTDEEDVYGFRITDENSSYVYICQDVTTDNDINTDEEILNLFLEEYCEHEDEIIAEYIGLIAESQGSIKIRDTVFKYKMISDILNTFFEKIDSEEE